jgi:hypothetical protein
VAIIKVIGLPVALVTALENLLKNLDNALFFIFHNDFF